MSAIDLTGKVAIVTGGGSGIGEECSLLLAERGARVVVVTSTAATAAPVIAAIRAAGGDAIEASGDVADEATAIAAVAAAMAKWGRVDILINNAAITGASFLARDTNVTEMEADVWQRTMAVNVIGPALFCKHAIPAMIAGGGGPMAQLARRSARVIMGLDHA